MIPRPHQIDAAKFLADRSVAMLADEPRVGKTGAAIMAADLELCSRILVVTTASGRAVWRQAFRDWSVLQRAPDDVVIVGWAELPKPKTLVPLLQRRWDLLILDEAHYAKSFGAQRTRAVFGTLAEDGATLTGYALCGQAERIWLLTGTPMPNSPADLFPFLRALEPDRLGPYQTFEAYRDQFCAWHPMKIGKGPFARRVEVITGGKNLDDLRERLKGFFLRRTQTDIGIMPPIYETMPLDFPAVLKRRFEGDVDLEAVLAAAEAGTTRELDMHLGTLRAATSEIKAHAAAIAANDAFDCGLDKLVLMVWHKKAIEILADKLAGHGVVVLDGSTPMHVREAGVRQFRADPKTKVFIGQILAAGEAIDLSAAAELWFVEASFTPKDMKQAALRVTNITQKRQVLVRVCVLEGSIDEAVQTVLLRKWAAIREVLK